MFYTETELAKLITSVEKEFRADLEKAEVMAKSEMPEEKKPMHEEKEKAPEHKEEASSEHKEAAPPQAEHEQHAAPKEGEAQHEHQAAPADPAMAQEGHDYDDEDMEHMHKMYMSMGKGELKAHHDAIRKCLDAQGGMAKSDVEAYAPHGTEGAESEASDAHGDKINVGLKKGADGIEANPPKGSPGAKSEASDAHGDKINVGLKKNERRGNGGEMSEQAPNNTPGAKSDASYTPNKETFGMKKSEDAGEVEMLKSEKEALQKTLDGVTEFLTKLVAKTNVPKGKAITSYEVVAKSEDFSETKPMTKSEIVGILSKKASDPSLSKSDRDAINNFYLNNANMNTISHLLK